MKTIELQTAFGSALHYHQAGRLDEAETLYEQILSKHPRHTDSLHFLGVLKQQKGQLAQAEQLIRQALKNQKNNANIHYNLANTLNSLGNIKEAQKHYETALRLDPSYLQAYINLGNVFHKLGKPKRALQCYRRLLDKAPRHAQAHSNIGIILKETGKLQDALRHFKTALQLEPDNPHIANNVGTLLADLGKPQEAIQCFNNILRAHPNIAEVYINLGNALLNLEAAHEAIAAYRKALSLNPRQVSAHIDIGNALNHIGNFSEAEKHYRAALALRPDSSKARSNLLFLLSYNVLCGPQEMLDAHREWDRIHGGPRKAATFARKHTPRRKPPLRIGYVSPDFRQHAVSYFFEPILGNHDPSQVEVFCYAEVKNPDAVTQRLQGLAHHWRSSVGLSDAQLAQRIFDDRIDVLVDLAGHTAGHRLGAFAYKPAPVQATYLGYFTTTGLETMDYWISDQILHPDDTCELATETIYRLPRCCLVYQPPVDAPPVAHRDPAQPIVFGSFNQIAKTSPQAVRLWAQVLRAVPNSRLLIKTNQLADPAVRDQLRAQFQQQGIDPQRLILRQRTAAHRDHLATYGEVDIALDTVPRTGGSTTADALWMGVPIVSLAGPRFIQRLSASMLHAVGLEELVAHSEQRYVDTAVSLARDHQRRQQLRAALRQRMAQSPLCNARDLAHALEKAFADMLEKSRHRAEHAP